MKKLLTFLLTLITIAAFSQSTTVVISQVYPGGGSGVAGVTYKKDYVELHNVSAVTQSLTGFSLQYGSGAGNFGSSATQIYAFPAGTSIPAGGYFLVELATPGAAGADLPVAADLSTTNLAMSATAGKVALVNVATGPGCGATATPCALPHSALIDVVSWGSANNAEGGTSVNNGVNLPANTNGAVRKNNGCTDTDNNNNDFNVVINPVPRNSASPIFSCAVTPTPTLSISSPLAAFGNQCINTTGGPNSFTVSGTDLTTADVAIAALAGFTYSTTSGGTYTSTLTLTHAAGAFTQQVFVKFDPTAVQSYNGNIVVSGGGAAASVNAAATGAGIDAAPTVTSGAASAITTTTATVAGSITATGCSAISAYGIEWSTTIGFPNGSGTAVPSSNLASGNFSSDLAGLSPATTYYYHAYATNAGGTTYGAEQSFTTASLSPSISTGALTAFGNVCVNTTTTDNSFTITGSNLTAAGITVAALAGYTYSLTSGGTYTTTLTIPQPGGSFSQTIFVKFTPTAVQSYNGDIVVSGGGVAAPVNVAASGAGVNTAPSVTTGAASAITTTTATLAGTITATGCTSVTAYGIEWSTNNGFPNGTGTQVASGNLSGGNFSSNLSSLTPSTTYYYHAYATNAGGTTYGAQQSFTTAAPPPPAMTATALTGFAATCINTTAGPNSFTLNGTNLTTANIVVGPFTGYTFSETSGGTYTATLTIAQAGGTQSKTVFVKFTPTAVQNYNGNIPVTGGGTTGTLSVAVTGSGINTTATVVTEQPANITTNSATLRGSISAGGCTAVSTVGAEISGVNGFANGTGTPIAGTLTGGNLITVNATGLVQGATYYYKAFADNAGGRAYGAQQTFTVAAIGEGFNIFPSPIVAGSEIKVTASDLKPGYYGVLFFNSGGQLVLQKNIHVQNNYINQTILIPGSLGRGVYRVHFVNNDKVLEQRSILVR